MRLFVFVLNDVDKLSDILAGFVEIGITGATILESAGMGRFLSEDLPIFAAFKPLMRESRRENRTLVSVVNDPAKVDRAIALIEEICGPLEESGAGIAFTIPIDSVRGLKPEIP